MAKSLKSKKIASPISTGDVGGDFESLVGAYYLAMVLLGSVPRGQEAGAAKEVKFQRLYEGEPLDDLIIISEYPVGIAKLAIQVKRDLVFGKKNEIFDEVICAGWKTFKSPQFVVGRDRFGFAVGLYSKTVDEHYQNVLSRARNSVNAEDFLKGLSTPGLFLKIQNGFVEMTRDKLKTYNGDEISDEELWNFLRSMVILHFDFQRAGSRDQSYIIEMLRHLIQPELQIKPSDIFLKIESYSRETKGVAGSLNFEMLRQKLMSDGFSLLTPPDCRGDLKRLKIHSDFILKDIKSDIVGLTLNRMDAINNAREKIKNSSLLELIGPPGVGKSAILKSLAEMQQAEGPVIVLAWDRIDGIGWDGFSNHLRLERSLKEILISVSSNSNPCIFVDGVDRIIEAGSRKAVNDLLRTLKETSLSQDNSKHWTLVVSMRDDNIQEFHSWVDWNSVCKTEQLRINDLEKEEIDLIFKRNPRLTPLLALPLLKPIIGNLFMLSLLADQRMIPEPDQRPKIASEIEVSKIWWQNLIGKDGEIGLQRQRALLQLGKEDVRLPGRWLSGDGISPSILLSLESDRILLRDIDRDLYRFRHDLLEDWVLYRVLDRERDNLSQYLKDIDQTFGLMRPIQLLGQSFLENHETVPLWGRLLKYIESDSNIPSRWRQALIAAPILSTHAQTLLDKVEPLLLNDKAKNLIDLLVALRTTQMDPDASFIKIAERIGNNADEIELLRNQSLFPRWRVWIPFMEWLLKKLDDFPENTRPEISRILEIWQLKTPYDFIYRKEVGNVAFCWLKEIER